MELWALDDLNQIAPITTYTDVRVEQRDLDVGTWSVTVPRSDGTRLADRWAAATWAGIEIYDPATGWRFGGFVDSVTEIRDIVYGDSVIFSGFDYQVLLQDRLDWPDSGEVANYWTSSGGVNYLTSHAHLIVYNNAGPGAISWRKIPHLVMETDPHGGPETDRPTSSRPLLEAIRELFAGRTDYTCRLVFRRLADGTPQLYFSTPTRAVSPLVLSAETGAYAKLVAVEQADVATHVIAMGAEYIPDAPNRLISGPLRTSVDWRTRHIETFINRPSIKTQDQLNTDAYNYADTLIRSRQVTVDGINVDGSFGKRVDIGWLIDVASGSSFGATLDRLPVTRSALTWDAGQGWRRTVSAGSSLPPGPESIYEGLATQARRLRTVEWGLGR